jgi:hypothetical protein
MTSIARTLMPAAAVLLAGLLPAPAGAATFAELSGSPAGASSMAGAPSPYGVPGPYAPAPYASSACPPNCLPGQPPQNAGAEGVYPGSFDALPYIPPYQLNPRAFLPLGPTGDLPANPMQLWSFSQINSTTDPFNTWGLSTPYMFVPWSTPLSGWTNAQTWNWWRERSGALPRNW